jgi:preprotein translocase subunit SecG
LFYRIGCGRIKNAGFNAGYMFLFGGLTMNIAVNIVHIVICIAIIAVVLLQSGRSAGISGAIAGGAETFFGKNKGRTIDAMLSKYTGVAAILFLITSIVLTLLLK